MTQPIVIPLPQHPASGLRPASQSAVERALATLDLTGLVACLQQLIAIPSTTGSNAESVAQHWLAERFAESGFEPDLWPIDLATTKAAPDFPGSEAPRSQAWGLVGSWGHSAGPTLVLNGHIDVVPPGDLRQWTDEQPYGGRVADGAVYGRGACDMKGGLVCNLFALKAIQAAGLQLQGRVLLQSVVSEEDGGLGTFATLRRGYRGDAAIITEPTRLNIIPACGGALTFRLRLSGCSTHASVRREGVSAIEKFWLVWQALEALEVRRNGPGHPLMKGLDLPYPLNVGTLQAGNWPSSVPDQLVAEGRLGVALGEDPQTARQELEATLAAVCAQDAWLREHPVQVEWFGGQFASGQISAEHSLVQLVSQCHQDLHDNQPQIHGAPYGSDLRLMVGLGNIPTLHYGPGNVKHAHAPDEPRVH
ncbi:ArgE/DapE family deacylase [Leptolyngbya sp. FACHB-261]|uniref:ArgE/DapE family deacylase n=1 Tax=Leptolyngbya sp. FACHB-261 TaxID=2692806 RepID=UPI0018EFEF95|nr:ArgE/DapE family deacylase [Leptolyngbya sp. FACHB-261]